MDLPKMKGCDVNLLQMAAALTPETYRRRSKAELTSAKPLPLAGVRVKKCSTNSVTGVPYMD